MNKIWLIMMMLGTAALLVINPSQTVTSMVDASSSALELCLNLCAVYAVWLGILEILDASGLSDKLAKLLRPLIKKLFPKANLETQKNIAINLSANMLGLGNASTPYGIKAMRGLDDGNEKANSSMIMLMIINACSIQLIPTTIIGLRAAAGSTSPSDIILPTIISSFTACAIGVGLAILCAKIFSKTKRRKI